MPRKNQTKAARSRTASKKRTSASSSSRRASGGSSKGAKARGGASSSRGASSRSSSSSRSKGRSASRGASSRERASMNGKRSGRGANELFDLLREDHRAVTEQFEEIVDLLEGDDRDASDEAQCLELFRGVYRDLTAHAKAEEQVVYPALLQHEETSDKAHEAQIEHALVESLLEQLVAADEFDEIWGAKLKVVSELVKHHVKEEEKQMFAGARKALDKGELGMIASDFEQAKDMMMAQLGDGGMAHVATH